jgi:hypothetical protein
MFAQTLGIAPAFDRTVQGQTGVQPEGAFFNFRSPWLYFVEPRELNDACSPVTGDQEERPPPVDACIV